MFAQIAILALFLEALVTSIKWTKNQDKSVSVWNIVSMVLGVLVTPLTGLDLFKAAGIPLAVPFVVWGQTAGGILGMVFTGMIVCRGSNVLYDLFKAISAAKDLIGKIPELLKLRG